MCALIFVNQLGFGSITPVIALYALSFGVSQSAIGLTIAIYGLARLASSLPSGYLADRIGRRRTLALGGLLTALGNVLCALAPTYAGFVASRFVAGAGAGLVIAAGQIVLADITTREQRGRVMAVYSAVFNFANGAGPYPGGLLAQRFGLPAPFLTYGLLGGAVAALAWFRVPETKSLRTAQTLQVAPPAPFRAQLRIMLGKPGFLLVCLINLVGSIARTGALFGLIPVLGLTRLALTADQIGLGLGLGSITALALGYPAGILADRFGRKPVIVPSTLLSGLAMLLFLVAPSFAWFLAACLVWSAAIGISGAAPAAYAADLAPPGMNAAAMSAYRLLSDSGYVLGPLLLGLIADLFGMEAALGLTAALLVAVAVAFALAAPETLRRRG
jgi:DHA1 family multidrug resistance protein-like MFS transporter